MDGYLLRMYLHENHQHKGVLTWEWLLRQANKLGMHGGSAFRSIAGFGRHHVVHEDHFFGMVGAITIELNFLVDEVEKNQLMELLKQENIQLFYTYTPAWFGMTLGQSTAG